MTVPVIDEGLLEWATPRQAEFIAAVNEHGGYRAAARALGTDHGTIHAAMRGLKSRAATKGYSPDHNMTRAVPDPYVVKGVSTYYDSEGEVRGQWVKSSLDGERRDAALRAAAEAMAETLPRLDPIEGPAETNADLCNLFTFTDCHVGMLAWEPEAGAPWNLHIAERTLTGCFDQLIRRAPNAKVAVINQLGDFMHYDSLTPVTPLHQHVLDADSRFSKMVGVAIRIIRRLIDVALMHHEEVHLILAEGNHDMAGSVWLRHMFRALYENEPRVTINFSELPFYYYQHGDTMLAFHHGHMVKNDQLPLLFAAQFPKVWGATTKRYAHCGHRHHVEDKEHSGMIVNQHPTLAARDAYAARGGWIADRAISAITYHTKFGQVAKSTVCPEMLS